MSRKFTWEVDKTSLILRVTDGSKETTWKIRKNTPVADISQVLEDAWLSLQDNKTMQDLANQLLPPVEASTWDAEELAGLERYAPIQADSEEASRAAQAAYVAQLNRSAKWFDVDDDETYGLPIPDFDSGEIRDER